MGPGALPGYHQSQCSLAPEDGFAPEAERI